tara:strand:+ start:1469 stop:1678 length:210 start_codon:yes stop_codon:yes gene_type:complete
VEIRCRHGAIGQVGLGAGDDHFPEDATPLAGKFIKVARPYSRKKFVSKLLPAQQVIADNVGNYPLPDLF